eukprot:m.54890 g.54890  ORF g.54890 m.54890 type:complete len:141 (+) comp7731_c1_seq8:1425-1847(+)
MFYTCIGIEANRVDAFPEVTSTLFYQAKTKGHHLHLWYSLQRAQQFHRTSNVCQKHQTNSSYPNSKQRITEISGSNGETHFRMEEASRMIAGAVCRTSRSVVFACMRSALFPVVANPSSFDGTQQHDRLPLQIRFHERHP